MYFYDPKNLQKLETLIKIGPFGMPKHLETWEDRFGQIWTLGDVRGGEFVFLLLVGLSWIVLLHGGCALYCYALGAVIWHKPVFVACSIRQFEFGVLGAQAPFVNSLSGQSWST